MKYLKYLIYLIIFLAVIAFAATKYFSEPMPYGSSGGEADQLAQDVLERLDKAAFDTIPYISFEFFRGGHKYFWDKLNEKVIIEWGENKVELNLKSMAYNSYEGGSKLQGDAAYKLKETAWSYWCNDSFWLIAPYKLFDNGTKRSIVEISPEEGSKGLLIQYESGGVTPGDSYLWMLDDKNKPTGWKMWTKILPVKGLYSSWENWRDFNGAQLSTAHTMAGKLVEMKNVKAGKNFTEFGHSTNPFNF